MSFDASPLTIRVPLPYDLPKGRAHTITAPVYRDGAAVAASAATCAIYNAGGTAITLTNAATVPSGVPTLVIAATDLDDEAFDDNWRVEWQITVSGTVYDSRHEAALVRSGLHPVITDDDLFRRHRGLDPDAGAGVSRTTRADYQDTIDEAWVEIMLRLRGMGRRPYLVMSPSSLRECHLALTLSLVFGDMGGGQGLQYMELAQMYRQQYEAAWGRLSFVYDENDDGLAEENRRTGGPSSIWLMDRAS